MYKLVAIDLDGTLLNMDKEISERNKTAIKKAQDKGIEIIVCSGRVYSGARLYAKQLYLNGPIIACNGAVISENPDGKLLYSNTLDTEDCMKIIEICHRNNAYFHVYADEKMLTEKLGFTSLKYFEKNKNLPKKDRVDIEVVTDIEERVKLMEGKVLKFVVVTDKPELLKNVRKELADISSVDLMSSNFDNVEVVNKGVNKGAALKRLSEILSIPSDEMVAIGDNENDISMFRFAGLSIAMDNGEKCAKEEADHITASNNDDGVAVAIEKYVLNL